MILQLNTNTSQTGRPKGSSVLDRFQSSVMSTLPPVLTLALPRAPVRLYISDDVLIRYAADLDPLDVDPIPEPLLGQAGIHLNWLHAPTVWRARSVTWSNICRMN